MMTMSRFGQEAEAYPVATVTPVASRDKDGDGGLSGAQIFITLLLSLLGGAIGYAVGYERAATKTIRSGSGGRSYSPYG